MFRSTRCDVERKIFKKWYGQALFKKQIKALPISNGMNKRFQSGQSLMEILIGLGIISIMVGTSTYALVTVLRTSSTTEQNQAAGLIGNSLLESASTLAEANWNSIYNLQKTLSNHYYLVRSSTTTPTPVAGDESVLEQDITNGLVGYWKFDEAGGSYAYDSSGNGNLGTLTNIPDLNNGLVGYWKLDEGSGTTVSDSSGNAKTGTLLGSPAWSDFLNCKFGNCLNFTGTNIVDAGTSMAGTWSGMTISAWINPASFASYRSVVQPAGSGDRALYVVSNGAIRLYPECASSNVVGLSTWSHVVATIDSSNLITYYVNGQPSGSCTGAITDRTVEYLRLAGSSTGDPEAFRGGIDEVRVYNRALTATEVTRLYNMNGCKAGSCIGFDGVNQYVDSDIDGIELNGTNYTIGGWYKITGNTRHVIAGLTQGSTAAYYYLSLEQWPDASNRIVAFVGDGSTYDTLTFGLTDAGINNWANIFLVRNGNIFNLYVNGVLFSTQSSSKIADLKRLLIGSRQSGNFMQGLIDDFRIYNRSLSASEISQIYNSQVYSRYFYVDNVNREICGTGSITSNTQSTCIGTSGVSEDPATQKITVGTYWNLKGVKQVLENYIYLTRWLNNGASQKDWSGSSGVDIANSDQETDYYSSTSIATTTSGTIKVLLGN